MLKAEIEKRYPGLGSMLGKFPELESLYSGFLEHMDDDQLDSLYSILLRDGAKMEKIQEEHKKNLEEAERQVQKVREHFLRKPG